MWRDDGLNPNDLPGLEGFVRVAAEDPIDKDEDFVLVVCHVVTYGGRKGFMPSVRIFDRSGNARACQTGDAHRGEGVETYASAREQGRGIFEQKQAEMRALMSSIEPHR